MAKTALELVIEAARIMQGITGANLALTPNNEMYLQMPDPGTLQRTAQAWLKEDIAEEGGASPSPQSDEPPTDDRWFAAYLKAQDSVLAAFLPEVLQILQRGTQAAKVSARELLCNDAPDFVKALADRALDAAREQAKETLP